MLAPSLLDWLLLGWMLVAVVAAIALRYVHAAYGRYSAESRAPRISARAGWIIMESVSLLAVAAFFFASDRMRQLPALLMFGLWTVHYVHRSWVYPFRANAPARTMPISIVAMAVVFNVVNASANGYWLFHAGPERPAAWLGDPRFVLGVLLFLGGMALNLSSDYRLLALRRVGAGAYQLPPDRGFFRWVSCPNYLGEIVEWCGWALASWSLAGLTFAVWTVANLAPRALAHHRWYHERFPTYPTSRKALIPFVL